MSATAWSDGPWSHVDNSWEFSTVYDQHGSVLASVPIHHLVTEETQDGYERSKEANARLIAASPDLFEALAEIDRLSLVILSAVNYADRDNLEAVSGVLKASRAALARARGEKP